MKQPPKKKDEDILTPAMKATILSTGSFFVVVMMALLFGMYLGDWFKQGTVASAFREEGLTLFQVSLFFSVYVFFQVWNMINCRSLTPETTGFERLFANKTFLIIMGTIIVVQIVIASVPPIGAIFFKETENVSAVEPLGLVTWIGILAATSSVLLFDVLMRWIRRRRLAQLSTEGQLAPASA